MNDSNKILDLKKYLDPDVISLSDKQEVARLLGCDPERLQFDNPKDLAMVFALLYESYLPYEFIKRRRQTVQQGIDNKSIKYFSQRKEYSKQNFLNHAIKGANSLFDRFQLSNHSPSDYVLLIDPTKNKRNYLIPNFNQRYRYSIAKALNSQLNKSSEQEILQRLYENYEVKILPLLSRAELLHESTDLSHTTSRIVRLPDEQDGTMGWLMLQPLTKESKIKRHIYNTGPIKIYFYRSKEVVLSQLTTQQEFVLKQQIRIKEALVCFDKPENERDDLFHTKTEEFYKKISRLVEILNGQADVEINIKLSLSEVNHIPNFRAMRNKIKSIIVDLKEKERSIKQVLQKNELHIKSLQTYSM